MLQHFGCITFRRNGISLCFNTFNFSRLGEIEIVWCCNTLSVLRLRTKQNSSGVTTLRMYNILTERTSSGVPTLRTYHFRTKWSSSIVTTFWRNNVETKLNLPPVGIRCAQYVIPKYTGLRPLVYQTRGIVNTCFCFLTSLWYHIKSLPSSR